MSPHWVIIHKSNQPNLAIGQKEKKKILRILLYFGNLLEVGTYCLKYGNFKILFSLQNQVILVHFFPQKSFGWIAIGFSLSTSGENKSKSFSGVTKVPFRVVCYFTKKYYNDAIVPVLVGAGPNKFFGLTKVRFGFLATWKIIRFCSMCTKDRLYIIRSHWHRTRSHTFCKVLCKALIKVSS